MWNFSLRTNQFKAENIFIALFNVCSGGVSESDRFVWDFTGRPACSGAQREKKKKKKKKSVWTGFIGFVRYLCGQVALPCRRTLDPFNRISIGTALTRCAEADFPLKIHQPPL